MPFSNLFKKSAKQETPKQTPASGDNVPNVLIKTIAANSASGSGTRRGLGEGMMSMREALNYGGKYILVHPEVLNKLKQNNIDPFLIYEAGMRLEMESKIPRIDFAGVNVDELLQAWAGKPQDQVPIHARQALWLDANANGLGYEKIGNGWKLK